MPVGEVSGAGSQTKTQNALKSLKLGADEFLKLLVTQIQYQDPLKPLEDKEFIAQTAQFTALEEQRTGNALLETIAIQGSRTSILDAASLIGKQATALYGSASISGEISAVCIEDGDLKVLLSGSLVSASDIVLIGRSPE